MRLKKIRVGPDPVDVYVGSQIKIHRRLRGMSQTALATGIGVTFQQVQKYEKGENRVGSSRLQHIAAILNVPVSAFFVGAELAGRAEVYGPSCSDLRCHWRARTDDGVYTDRKQTAPSKYYRTGGSGGGNSGGAARGIKERHLWPASVASRYMRPRRFLRMQLKLAAWRTVLHKFVNVPYSFFSAYLLGNGAAHIAHRSSRRCQGRERVNGVHRPAAGKFFSRGPCRDRNTDVAGAEA